MKNESELRVMHALRLKAFGDTDAVASAAGLSIDKAQAILDDLQSRALVRYREGAITGWMLTPDGRAHGESLLANQLDRAGMRDQLEAIYGRFLELNQPFLQLCTDWQVRTVDGSPATNDHHDAVYDRSVIERLSETNALIQPICGDLAALLDRFSHYGPSFTTALTHVRNGELDWFTKPIIDSYHTVWFELHEDLLASLGIDRAREVPA